MKCLTLLLATRSKAADGSEDWRAQPTQKENNNNLKNHDKLAVCQFTWLLGITTALSLMKDEFQGKRGSTWQEHLYIMDYSDLNLSIELRKSVIPVTGIALKRSMQNVIQWEKLLVPLINKLNPTLLL